MTGKNKNIFDKQEMCDAICEMKKGDVIELTTGDYIEKTNFTVYPFRLNSESPRLTLIEVTDKLIKKYNLE